MQENRRSPRSSRGDWIQGTSSRKRGSSEGEQIVVIYLADVYLPTYLPQELTDHLFCQRSFLRNLLMHSFHLFLRLLTPPATASIKDTQCGFKLFSRPSLPYIIPYMHSEGWIFDVEILMLAEAARIPVAEVAVGWKEVKGSKLNVIWDSLGMAWGLAVLRAAWAFGVYRRH